MSNDNIKPMKILCISGGGVKGISALATLVEIEKTTGNPICKLFNIFCGTSVGALILGLLLIPKKDNPEEPLYTAEDALKIVKDRAHEIFPRKCCNWGLFSSKHHSQPLDLLCN